MPVKSITASTGARPRRCLPAPRRSRRGTRSARPARPLLGAERGAPSRCRAGRSSLAPGESRSMMTNRAFHEPCSLPSSAGLRPPLRPRRPECASRRRRVSDAHALPDRWRLWHGHALLPRRGDRLHPGPRRRTTADVLRHVPHSLSGRVQGELRLRRRLHVHDVGHDVRLRRRVERARRGRAHAVQSGAGAADVPVRRWCGVSDGAEPLRWRDVPVLGRRDVHADGDRVVLLEQFVSFRVDLRLGELRAALLRLWRQQRERWSLRLGKLERRAGIDGQQFEVRVRRRG